MPEYQCRLRWRPGTLALWDNLACQHYAARDYWPQPRELERVCQLAAPRTTKALRGPQAGSAQLLDALPRSRSPVLA